jgi:hypothetical protein
MSKSFEPRFLCSKIHSNPHSCISKFYAIFWDFSQIFLPPKSFYSNSNPIFNPENQLKLILFYSFGFQPEKQIRPSRPASPPPGLGLPAGPSRLAHRPISSPAHRPAQASQPARHWRILGNTFSYLKRAFRPCRRLSLLSLTCGPHMSVLSSPPRRPRPRPRLHRPALRHRTGSPPAPPPLPETAPHLHSPLPPPFPFPRCRFKAVTAAPIEAPPSRRHYYRPATSPPPRPYKRSASPRPTPPRSSSLPPFTSSPRAPRTPSAAAAVRSSPSSAHLRPAAARPCSR